MKMSAWASRSWSRSVAQKTTCRATEPSMLDSGWGLEAQCRVLVETVEDEEMMARTWESLSRRSLDGGRRSIGGPSPHKLPTYLDQPHPRKEARSLAGLACAPWAGDHPGPPTCIPALRS